VLTLTAEELRELTARVRSDAQQVQLRAMGIPFFVRKDGTVAVLRVSVEGRATIPDREPALRP
jgi:hypothetical protein